MKIKNIASGKYYELTPDTTLEVERTNPFFNEYGEQTVPVSMPASEHNLNILNWPDRLAAGIKQQANIDVSVEDNGFYIVGRQAILTTQRYGSVSTSFYLNDGAFYSKLEDLKISDVFGSETIPGITTVDQGIAFCRSLRDNSNEHFTIFPALIDAESVDSDETSTPIGYGYIRSYLERYKFLNRFGKLADDGTWTDGNDGDFYNAVNRSETVSSSTVYLTPGFYITPFMRVNYLIERIFSYLGYTISDNFFNQTSQFKNLVLLTNVMDVLVNGPIKLVDLLPTGTLKNFLDIFRHKFCCEFIPDEITKTMDIVSFSDAITATPTVDLTSRLTSEPEISYPDQYMALKLSSGDAASDDLSSSNTFDSMKDLLSKYPTAVFDPNDGCWYRTQFFPSGRQKIANTNFAYHEGATEKDSEISVDDCIVEMRSIVQSGRIESIPFIGSSQALNSTIGTSTTESTSNDTKINTMFCFAYVESGEVKGSAASYKNKKKILDYSLYYYGTEGIFEKFYRKYDEMLRNSKHTVKCNLLLSDLDKMSLKASELMVLQGQRVFINSLKYTLGGNGTTEESTFYTTKSHTPLSEALYPDELQNKAETGYYWESEVSDANITEEEYEASDNHKYNAVYPGVPSSKFVLGQHYYQQSYTESSWYTDASSGKKITVYHKYTLWLELKYKAS